jgi:hypothetical protein
MKTQLLFKNLFAKALKDWPEEIVFGKLTHYSMPDGGRGYSIEGMEGFPENIQHSYIDHQYEILMGILHYRIYAVLCDLAKDSIRIKMQNLRSETIQKEFESHIKNALVEQERLKRREDDANLIQSYFKVNYPEK